jgi:hypothetical protein
VSGTLALRFASFRRESERKKIEMIIRVQIKQRRQKALMNKISR